MGPVEATKAVGKRPTWVAEQMGICRSYLWRMMTGKRRWPSHRRQQFALALGMAETAIDFASCIGQSPTDRGPLVTLPCTAPSAAQAARKRGSGSPVPRKRAGAKSGAVQAKTGEAA